VPFSFEFVGAGVHHRPGLRLGFGFVGGYHRPAVRFGFVFVGARLAAPAKPTPKR